MFPGRVSDRRRIKFPGCSRDIDCTPIAHVWINNLMAGLGMQADRTRARTVKVRRRLVRSINLISFPVGQDNILPYTLWVLNCGR